MNKQKAVVDPAFLKQQRKRLTAMRDQMLSTGSVGSANERAPNAGEAKEIEDDAQDLAQGEIDGTIDAVEEQRLRAVERALAKLEDGTYGLSDLSGDPITKARLEAMPEAALAIQEEEAREKHDKLLDRHPSFLPLRG